MCLLGLFCLAGVADEIPRAGDIKLKLDTKLGAGLKLVLELSHVIELEC
jgi:hypothetical protein